MRNARVWTLLAGLCLASFSSCGGGGGAASPAAPASCTLTVTLGAGTSGSPAATATFVQGTAVPYSYSALAGFAGLQVTLDGASAPASGSVTMNAAHALAATAHPQNCVVTFVAGTGGTLLGTSPQSVAYGAGTAAVQAVPNGGFAFENWTGTSGFVTTTSNPLTLSSVTADTVVTANFKVVPGPVPSEVPVDVTFVDASGVPQTVPAYPGEVLVLSNPGLTEPVVAGLAARYNGRVLTRAQDLSMFTVIVEPGQEAAFIQDARANAGVFFVCPDLASYPAASGLWIIDDFKNALATNCPTTHGGAVKALAGEGTVVDVGGSTGATRVHQIMQDARDIATANQASGDVVINISQGSYGKTEPANLSAETTFLASLGNEMLQPGFPLDNTVVVVAAGNGVNGDSKTQGSDIGAWLNNMYDTYPQLVGHLVVVGGSGAKGNCGQDRLCNFTDLNNDKAGNPLMPKAPNRGLEVPGTNCVVDGTSFAAPQFAGGLTGALRARSPGTSLADAVKNFIKANTSLDPRCYPATYSGEFQITKTTDQTTVNGIDTITVHSVSVFTVNLTFALNPNAVPPKPGQKVYALTSGFLKAYSVSGTRILKSTTGFTSTQPIVPDPSRPVNNNPVSCSLVVDFTNQNATLVLSTGAWAAFFFEDNPIPYVSWQDYLRDGTFNAGMDSDRNLVVAAQGTSHPATGATETVTSNGGQLNKGN